MIRNKKHNTILNSIHLKSKTTTVRNPTYTQNTHTAHKCMRSCIHLHESTCICIHTHKHAYIHTYTDTHICTHSHTDMYTLKYTHTSMHTHAYIHVQAYTQTCTYTSHKYTSKHFYTNTKS